MGARKSLPTTRYLHQGRGYSSGQVQGQSLSSSCRRTRRNFLGSCRFDGELGRPVPPRYVYNLESKSSDRNLRFIASSVNELKGEAIPSFLSGAHTFVQKRPHGVMCVRLAMRLCILMYCLFLQRWNSSLECSNDSGYSCCRCSNHLWQHCRSEIFRSQSKESVFCR
jgi:hypothetical protein